MRRERAEQRALAASVGADQPHHLARADHEVDPVDNPPATDRNAEAVGLECAHASILRVRSAKTSSGGAPSSAVITPSLSSEPCVSHAPSRPAASAPPH